MDVEQMMDMAAERAAAKEDARLREEQRILQNNVATMKRALPEEAWVALGVDLSKAVTVTMQAPALGEPKRCFTRVSGEVKVFGTDLEVCFDMKTFTRVECRVVVPASVGLFECRLEVPEVASGREGHFHDENLANVGQMFLDYLRRGEAS